VPGRGPYDFATAFAEKLLRDEFKIDKLSIDPIAIARVAASASRRCLKITMACPACSSMRTESPR